MPTVARRTLPALLGASLLALPLCRRIAADTLTRLRLDYAYYNPVSLVLKEQGLIEREFAKDGIKVDWVLSLGSNKALEFLSGNSIDFGSTAGAAALLGKANGNPVKTHLCLFQAGMDGAGHAQGLADPQRRGSQGKRIAVTKGTDPYIFLVRALASHGLKVQDVEDGAAAASRRQGGAGARRRRCLGRARSVYGADRAREGLAPLLPQRRFQHLWRAQRARGFRRRASRDHRARARRLREGAARGRWPIPTSSKPSSPRPRS